MVVVNQAGDIVLLNVQAEKQFGYRRDELLGQPVTNIIPEGFAERLVADELRSAEDALAQQIGTGIELTARRRDGTEFPIEIMLSPLDSADGILVTAAIRDISGRRAAEDRNRALTEQTERAQFATQAKNEFLGRMSHELRTPLNAILGFAQLLGLDGLDGDQRESVDQILKGGRHLLELINEVLDISQIEIGQLGLSLEPVDVSEIVTNSISLVGPLGAECGVGLRSELPDGEWHILADLQRMRQVLLNLLANAVKYSPPGATATVGADRVDGGRIRITVTDTGPGIPAELLSRLFMPFDRLGAAATAVEGTGLGLALSKALVEAMGGTIGVDSTVGVGSRFWFELPGAAPVTLGPAVVTHISPAPGTAAVGTVLYIEDNVSNFRLIERALALRGEILLIPAMLGGLGLDLAREHRPDLILLDLHLPDIPGEELLGRLLADPATRAIPVVILSADATPGQVDRLLTQGARAYLTKPVDIGEFLALVDGVLPPGTPADPGTP